MSGLHSCQHCGYSFPDAGSLRAHLDGGWCPDEGLMVRADDVERLRRALGCRSCGHPVGQHTPTGCTRCTCQEAEPRA